jgi:glucokinase
MKTALGVDIGGTKIAFGLVNDAGVKASSSIPTGEDPDESMERLAGAIGELLRENGWDWEDLNGIGVGAPGPLLPREGRLLNPPNLPGWANYPVVQKLKQVYPGRVRLDNDANCAALGEKYFGAARPFDTFAYITISTGIGSGLFAEGKLLSGRTGNAGEIGHIAIDPHAGECPSCGQRGCLEYLASGTGIARRGTAVYGRPMRAEEIVEAFRRGEEPAQRILEETFRYIGIGCVTLVNLFEPEAILIGGGVSQIGEPLFRAVSAYVNRYALHRQAGEIPILPAQLSQDVGVVGAAVLILQEQGA